MAAANRAYIIGDEQQLAAVLKEWEESPEAVEGHSPAAELLRAVRQIARVQERVTRVEREIAELAASDLHHLRIEVEAAEASGRDMLAEMAAAIDPQIARARVRLDALRREAEP